MSKWAPAEDHVKASELVGRRLFGKPYLEWLDDHPSPANFKLAPDAFEDTRLQEDLSMDRLGEGTPIKAVVRGLTKLADDEAEKRNKAFCGWAAACAKDLRAVTVRPIPLKENPFHAEIDRTDMRTKLLAYHFANSLRLLFQLHGRYVSPIRGKQPD